MMEIGHMNLGSTEVTGIWLELWSDQFPVINPKESLCHEVPG